MRKGTNNRSNRKKTKQYDKKRNEKIKFHAPFEALRGFATNKREYLHTKKSEKAEVNDKPRYKACTKTRKSSSRGRVGRKRFPEVKKILLTFEQLLRFQMSQKPSPNSSASVAVDPPPFFHLPPLQ